MVRIVKNEVGKESEFDWEKNNVWRKRKERQIDGKCGKEERNIERIMRDGKKTEREKERN